MQYLHGASPPICHADLKSSNILCVPRLYSLVPCCSRTFTFSVPSVSLMFETDRISSTLRPHRPKLRCSNLRQSERRDPCVVSRSASSCQPFLNQSLNRFRRLSLTSLEIRVDRGLRAKVSDFGLTVTMQRCSHTSFLSLLFSPLFLFLSLSLSLYLTSVSLAHLSVSLALALSLSLARFLSALPLPSRSDCCNLSYAAMNSKPLL
jgi:hypothetical protein